MQHTKHFLLVLALTAPTFAFAQPQNIEQIVQEDFQNDIEYSKKQKQHKMLLLDVQIEETKKKLKEAKAAETPSLAMPYVETKLPELSKPALNKDSKELLETPLPPMNEPVVTLLKVFKRNGQMFAQVRYHGEIKVVSNGMSFGKNKVIRISAGALEYRNERGHEFTVEL